MAKTMKINAFNDGVLEGVNIAEAKNLMVPDSLQDKYKRKKQIEDYHKNKLKLRKKGII